MLHRSYQSAHRNRLISQGAECSPAAAYVNVQAFVFGIKSAKKPV